MVLEKMRFRFVQMKSILPGEWLFMGTKRSKLSKSWKIFSRMSSKNVAIYICWNVRTFLSSDTVFSYFHYKNDFTVTFTFDEGYFYTLYSKNKRSEKLSEYLPKWAQIKIFVSCYSYCSCSRHVQLLSTFPKYHKFESLPWYLSKMELI
jgi:hypothetical protein